MFISESGIHIFALFEMHFRLLVYVESGLFQKKSKREGVEDMWRNFQGYYWRNSMWKFQGSIKKWSGISRVIKKIMWNFFGSCFSKGCNTILQSFYFRGEIWFFCNFEERVKGFGFFLK